MNIKQTNICVSEKMKIYQTTNIWPLIPAKFAYKAHGILRNVLQTWTIISAIQKMANCEHSKISEQ